MESKEKKYKVIVVSDVHLGSKNSKAKQIARYLKYNTCDTLILNGDIIDGWQLKRRGVWKKKHTRFFRQVLKMIEKNNTEVIYVRGNHDDFMDEVVPLQIGPFKMVREYIYEAFGNKYYITHGDIFDSITTNLKWLALLGDTGYTFLLWLNRKVNYYRTRRGLPYYSLSQKVKNKVKKAVSYVDDFEMQLSVMAHQKKCDGIICGHIHQPANKRIHGIHYLNSGDWVESLSALTLDFNGNWNIEYYEEWNAARELEKPGSSEIKTIKNQLIAS